MWSYHQSGCLKYHLLSKRIADAQCPLPPAKRQGRFCLLGGPMQDSPILSNYDG